MFTNSVYSEILGNETRATNHRDCGYQTTDKIIETINAGVAAGEIADPSLKILPAIQPRKQSGGVAARGVVPTMSQHDLFLFEDRTRLLTTNFTDSQLFNLMGDAATDVLVEHGDNFDFIGFFLNFTAHHELGSAFYLGMENDVSGIGQGSFNFRSSLGIGGENVEGLVMMWNQISWPTGTNNITQLVLGQEFEHRFAMFLNPISGGRSLQGTNSSCGRKYHWDFRVDGQGSAMEIAEWTGTSSLARVGGFINYNADIGGIFSYPDLYLMGYVSPEEMDTLSSELRYLNNNTDCSSPYNGTVSTWDSSDIIATNGVRVPSSFTSQKNFRTAWVVIHLPNELPTSSELDRIVDMLNHWSDTWAFSTLNRGTMDNTVDVPFDIIYPDGTPDFIAPLQPTKVLVRTINLSGSANSDSGLLHFSINGGAYQTTPLAYAGGNDFIATIPEVVCTNIVDFYVSIESMDGRTIQVPRAAPGTVNTCVAGNTPIVIFVDDFETDLGWTVSNSGGLTDGAWDRGIPLGLGDRGDPATDFDGSGQCYLTDHFDGNTDVDDGVTTLTSPVINLSGAEQAVIQYARWFTNDFGAAPGEDFWIVEVTSDGVDWVELENSNISNGWDVKTFQMADFISLTDQVQIRFIASDLSFGSVVEAAVDAIRITTMSCNDIVCLESSPVLPDPSGILKSRYIAFIPDNPGLDSAIRVTLSDLDLFSEMNGEIRWVGPPQEYWDGQTANPTFMAAQLVCEPHYQDWGSVGLLSVYGTEVVPFSMYRIQTIANHCGVVDESLYSTPINIFTGKWCDTIEPFFDGSGSQPDINDVVAVVGKFLGRLNPPKLSSQFQPNLLDPSLSVNISDILAVVDAFLGQIYLLEGPDLCP